MQTQINNFPIQARRIVRQKLDKHKKLQKLTTQIYLKYCNLVGFTHILPDFLIIGFPKCGTTSLYEYLLEHPDIHPPIGKEIDYFDRLYFRGKNWYKVRFPTIFEKSFFTKVLGRNFLTGEATPRYAIHPHALNRIKKFIPKVKFIILLRNPIDRAFSHYNMNFRNGYENLSFEEAIKKEESRIKGRYEKMSSKENYYSWDYDLFAYLQQGIYYEKIKKWFEIFPRDQFLIIQSEDFLKNPSLVYNKTLEFLNLSKWEPDTITFFKKRSYKGQKIQPEIRKKLKDYFQPHNERLYKLIEKNFDWE